jgi:caffeoyl-CoA O-methyltransferase
MLISRRPVLLAIAFALALPVCAPTAQAQPAQPAPAKPAARAVVEVPPQAAAVLKRIKAADTDMLAVSEEDGRMLRLLIVTSGAKHALEIGGANGYSAIWTGLGLRETGGTLVTIEYDPQRAKTLDANIKEAGLSDIVRVISGDAFKAIPTVTGTFDFVFCDAWKRDYQKFFEMVFPRLDRGGLFVAHNVVNKATEMGDFLKTVRSNPAIVSAIVSPSGEGISISWKR